MFSFFFFLYIAYSKHLDRLHIESWKNTVQLVTTLYWISRERLSAKPLLLRATHGRPHTRTHLSLLIMHVRSILGSCAAPRNPSKTVWGWKTHTTTTSCGPRSTSCHSLTAQASSSRDVKTNTRCRRPWDARRLKGRNGIWELRCPGDSRHSHQRTCLPTPPLPDSPTLLGITSFWI